ncbi:MAG: P-loop NTPase fold protein [Pelagibaca sp.]
MPWEKDVLLRSETAKLFEKLADSAGSNNVFLVSASFGQGKTFFVKNWSEQLSDDNWPHLVFDAWKHDFSTSPLAAFVSSVNVAAQKNYDTPARARILEKLNKFAKKAAPILLASGAKTAVRMMTLGALDGNVDTLKELLIEQGADAALLASEEAIQALSMTMQQELLFDDLQRSFSEVVEQLRSEQPDKPVIVIIDELDRCRPEFVFNLLEDIKHILHNSNAVFYIFCDENVLTSQAKKTFGDRQAGEAYIRKFFDHHLRLPNRKRSDFCFKCINATFTGGRYIKDSARTHLKHVLTQSPLSLRQIEHTVSFCSILVDCNSEIFEDWPLAIYLLVLREAFPQLYDEIATGEITDGLPDCFLAQEHPTYSVAQAVDAALKQNPNDTIGQLNSSLADENENFKNMVQFVFHQQQFWHARKTVREIRRSIVAEIESIGLHVG